MAIAKYKTVAKLKFVTTISSQPKIFSGRIIW